MGLDGEYHGKALPWEVAQGRLQQARASAMLRLEGGLRLVTDDSKVRENATAPEKWGFNGIL